MLSFGLFGLSTAFSPSLKNLRRSELFYRDGNDDYYRRPFYKVDTSAYVESIERLGDVPIIQDDGEVCEEEEEFWWFANPPVTKDLPHPNRPTICISPQRKGFTTYPEPRPPTSTPHPAWLLSQLEELQKQKKEALREKAEKQKTYFQATEGTMLLAATGSFSLCHDPVTTLMVTYITAIATLSPKGDVLREIGDSTCKMVKALSENEKIQDAVKSMIGSLQQVGEAEINSALENTKTWMGQAASNVKDSFQSIFSPDPVRFLDQSETTAFVPRPASASADTEKVHIEVTPAMDEMIQEEVLSLSSLGNSDRKMLDPAKHPVVAEILQECQSRTEVNEMADDSQVEVVTKLQGKTNFLLQKENSISSQPPGLHNEEALHTEQPEPVLEVGSLTAGFTTPGGNNPEVFDNFVPKKRMKLESPFVLQYHPRSEPLWGVNTNWKTWPIAQVFGSSTLEDGK